MSTVCGCPRFAVRYHGTPGVGGEVEWETFRRLRPDDRAEDLPLAPIPGKVQGWSLWQRHVEGGWSCYGTVGPDGVFRAVPVLDTLASMSSIIALGMEAAYQEMGAESYLASAMGNTVIKGGNCDAN